MVRFNPPYILGTLAALGLAGLVSIILFEAAVPGNHNHSLTKEQIASETAKQQKAVEEGKIAAFGTVVDKGGRPVEDSQVLLTVVNEKREVVWQVQRPVHQGFFEILPDDIPSLPTVVAGVVAAEAPRYLAEKVNVTLQRAGQSIVANPVNPIPPNQNQPNSSQTRESIRILPSRIHLQLTSFNPWLTALLFLPAMLGLLLAIIHMTHFARGMWVTYWYAAATSSLWSVIIGALLYRYVTGQDSLIPLFWSDLFVSEGVVLFAFLGSVIYVAFSMNEKPEGFYFDANLKIRRKVLLAATGRVLVAPYVALTGYGIFAATFPNLRTGAFAAFFGFFTGLFIKVVLEALNDIGLRFLSVEARQKVAQNMARTDLASADQSPVSDARLLLPEPSFLAAVAEAQKELLKKDGVLGVAPGFRLTSESSDQNENAIIVYVREKRDISPSDPAFVPPTYRGYSTDVISLPPAGPDEVCRPVNSKLS